MQSNFAKTGSSHRNGFDLRCDKADAAMPLPVLSSWSLWSRRSERSFDGVTLDLSLDDGDGMDMLKAIAGGPLAGPIVAISGMDCRASSCRATQCTFAPDRSCGPAHFPSPIISRRINVSYRAEQHETGVDNFEQPTQLEIARCDIIQIEELSEPPIVTVGLHFGLDRVAAGAHALSRRGGPT